MWLLCRLSIYEEPIDSNFECQLILEYADNSLAEVIDINVPETTHESWLSLDRQQRPFDTLDDIDVLNKEQVSLVISCLINFSKLQAIKSKLTYIYLWSAVSSKNINLEILHLPHQLDKVRTHNSKKNMFVQVYPIVSEKTPSKRYEYLENHRNDSEGLPELLAIINGDKEKALVASDTEEIIAASDDINGVLELLDGSDEDIVWSVFSIQDLETLVQGFKDWQRVHGKNDLMDQLPPELIAKMGQQYTVAFWTSGQGVSNMVRDHNPPRHTMVVSLIQTSGEYGIGYCIQRPTSLDKIWSHQKWHRIKVNDNEILQASLIEI